MRLMRTDISADTEDTEIRPQNSKVAEQEFLRTPEDTKEDIELDDEEDEEREEQKGFGASRPKQHTTYYGNLHTARADSHGKPKWFVGPDCSF